MLAKGNDAKLQTPAKNDLKAGKELSAQVVAGDGWYDLLEGQQDEAIKMTLQSRAVYWYKLASEGMHSQG